MRKHKETEPIRLSEEEKKFETSLRPKNLSEFFGQKKIVDNLKVFISAAKKKRRCVRSLFIDWTAGIRQNNFSSYNSK